MSVLYVIEGNIEEFQNKWNLIYEEPPILGRLSYDYSCFKELDAGKTKFLIKNFSSNEKSELKIALNAVIKSDYITSLVASVGKPEELVEFQFLKPNEDLFKIIYNENLNAYSEEQLLEMVDDTEIVDDTNKRIARGFLWLLYGQINNVLMLVDDGLVLEIEGYDYKRSIKRLYKQLVLENLIGAEEEYNNFKKAFVVEYVGDGYQKIVWKSSAVLLAYLLDQLYSKKLLNYDDRLNKKTELLFLNKNRKPISSFKQTRSGYINSKKGKPIGYKIVDRIIDKLKDS